MASSRLNVNLLARTAGVVVVLAGVTVFVHAWQVKQHARGQLALADDARRDGKHDDVVAALGRYLTFDPDNREMRGRYALAIAERAKSNRERWRALQALRQATAGVVETSEVRVRAAELALELGEPGLAEKSLAPLLKANPERLDLLELAVRCSLDRGDVPAAVVNLRKVVELAPDRVSAAVKLAELLRDRLEDPHQADAFLDQLVRQNPRLAAAWLARARFRLGRDLLDAAEKDLAKARELAPKNVEVLEESARLAERQDRPKEAADLWARAVAERPDDPTLYLGLARAHKDNDQLTAALRALRDGLARAAGNVELTFALADLLLDKNERAEAAALRKALPVKAAKGRGLFLDGRLAEKDKKWFEAARFFVDALQADDVKPELASRLMLELATCYGELGARDEQFLAAAQAVRMHPSPRAKLRLSQLLLSVGQGEDALPLLQSLTRLPTPPPAAYGMLARALLEHYRSKPLWQRRWREVEQALAEASDDPAQVVAAIILHAEMLWLRQESPAAREILEEALAEHPKEPLLYLALADLATREGDARRAREVLQRGDSALAGRFSWLLARANRLAGHRDPASVRELLRLEETSRRLPRVDCDRLQRRLADIHAGMNHHSDVERLTRLILARHPADIAARLLLVDALLARKDTAAAGQVVEQLKRIEGPDGTAWRSAAVACRLEEARNGRRAGLAEARPLVEEMQQLRPGWSQAAFLAGKLADLEDRPDDAIAHYQHVLALGELHPHALTRLVQLLIERDRWKDATEVIEQARRQGGLDPSFLRSAAWIALRAGNADRARDLAFLAVPPGSRSYQELLWRGRILEAANRPTEAEEAFDRALRLAPDVADTWLARVQQLLKRGDRDEAEVLLGQMAHDLPAARRAYGLGEAQEMLGNYAEAERHYREQLAKQPRDARVLQKLAEFYLKRNEPLQAEAVLRQLLGGKVAPAEEDLPDLRRKLAFVLTAPEQPRDRVEEALAVLALNANAATDPQADQRVAALARRSLAELAKLPPGDQEEQIRLARLHEDAGSWPKAREILLGVVAKEPGNGAAIVALIDALVRQGKRSEAETWLDRLKRAEPEYPHLADVEERVQRLAKQQRYS